MQSYNQKMRNLPKIELVPTILQSFSSTLYFYSLQEVPVRKKIVKKMLFTRWYLNQRFSNKGPLGFILAEFEARSFFDDFHV